VNRVLNLAGLWSLALITFAQGRGWPSGVTAVASKSNETVAVAGDLASGKIIEDLSWAANSSNACFPATQNLKFRGPHVFYATTIAPRSVMKVSVKPEDGKANLSLYGYMNGSQDFSLVPDLPRCITCEADHKWDRPWKGKAQTAERTIEFRNPTANTYNILIGVTAPKDVTSGKFKVEIRTES